MMWLYETLTTKDCEPLTGHFSLGHSQYVRGRNTQMCQLLIPTPHAPPSVTYGCCFHISFLNMILLFKKCSLQKGFYTVGPCLKAHGFPVTPSITRPQLRFRGSSRQSVSLPSTWGGAIHTANHTESLLCVARASA